MNTLESLNTTFKKVNELYVEQRRLLKEYLDKALQYAGGSVVMTGYYEDHDQAANNDVEFDEQFPACVTVYDKHCFHHEILVTKLYKHNDLFYVDGYDRLDGEWTTFWYTDDSNDTLDSLATFVNSVLNPKEEEVEEEKDADEVDNTFTSQVIGWQIVDDEQNYPSEFGCWDAFRTKEDAEAYIEDNLDPDEYHTVEEWSTSNVDSSKYRFFELKERTFTRKERVWIKEEFHNRYAEICKTETVRWDNDTVKIKELNTGDEWVENWVKAGHIYQADKDKKCPLCGNTLHINHQDEAHHTHYCPECNKYMD